MGTLQVSSVSDHLTCLFVSGCVFLILMSLTGPKVEVLRQQQPRINIDSPPHRDTVSALVPPTKSPFRLHNRFVLRFSKDLFNF